MRFRTAAFSTALALALATFPAAAEGDNPHRHGPGHGDGGPVMHMLQELGLNDSQMTQAKAVTTKYMDGALGQAMSSMRTARGTLQKAIHDTTQSEAQVREAAAAVAVLDAEAAVQHHKMAIEISSILTADQKAKLSDMFEHMEERHRGPPPSASGGF